jgi:2-polyprenyl-3-methyl-5-hydroxy-6-metoxy-1,4-benzoquinol methylase
MVSHEEVEYAYRLFLDREPESASVVATLAETSSSLQRLRAIFLASPEFQTHVAGLVNRSATKPLNWDRSHVEVRASPDEFVRMTRHVEGAWEELGRLEPHWSVITQEQYRAATFAKNTEGFFESGEIEAEAMRASAARYGIRLEDYKNCFELGCGVGRVTIWLARLFSQVIASDISLPHIDIARKTVERHGCTNVKWLKLDVLADLESLSELDAFFSVIVLQHNPPPVIAQILRTLLKKLKPNGIGYFQVPTYSQGYNFDVRDYLDNLVHTGSMEMHVLPQDALFALVEECGCQLLEIREDDRTGSPTMVSNAVLVRKRLPTSLSIR